MVFLFVEAKLGPSIALSYILLMKPHNVQGLKVLRSNLCPTNLTPTTFIKDIMRDAERN